MTSATVGTRANGSGVGTRASRAAIVLLVPVAVFAWVVFLHGRFVKQSIAEFRLSLHEQRRRRTRNGIRCSVLMLLLIGMYAPLTQPVSVALLTFSTNVTTALPLATLIVVVITLPESMRITFVARRTRTLPACTVGLYMVRCILAWVKFGDPLYFDKQVACHVYARVMTMLWFVFVGLSTYLDVPTLSVAVAMALGGPFIGNVLGACRDDGVAIGSVLLYFGILCVLHRLSRKRARAVARYVVRKERAVRGVAEEVADEISKYGKDMELGAANGEEAATAGVYATKHGRT